MKLRVQKRQAHGGEHKELRSVAGWVIADAVREKRCTYFVQHEQVLCRRNASGCRKKASEGSPGFRSHDYQGDKDLGTMRTKAFIGKNRGGAKDLRDQETP